MALQWAAVCTSPEVSDENEKAPENAPCDLGRRLSGRCQWQVADDHSQGSPLIATVMKQELMELGVPEEAIVTEEESINTHQQLLGLQQIVQEGKGDNVLILTNEYHVKRVQVMIEYRPRLSLLKGLLALGQLKVQAAEEILIERDPEKWQAEIDRVYKSEAMQARIKGEADGVRQIHEGTYRFG